MKTREFISTLRRSPDKRLVFAGESGQTVRPGYHLTEIKAAAFDTVDCGGQVNHWRETILQVWLPAAADNDYMTSGKFLRIYDKVRGLVALDDESEVRIEYGDENFFPSTYYVASVSQDAKSIHIMLRAPAATCKARDRASGEGQACCAA